MSAKYLVAVAVLLGGCAAYALKTPDNFDAEPVEVTGKTKNLQIGPYRLSSYERGWTRGKGFQIMSVRSAKQSQKYEFRLGRDSLAESLTQCEFAASEKSLDARGGWSFTLGESAELACRIVAAEDTSRLNISTDGNTVLAGSFVTPHSYRVQGVGMNELSKGMTGPVGGFHIFDGDRPVAAVQIVNDKRVLFARGLDQQQRDLLAPAIAALLLLDQSLVDMD